MKTHDSEVLALINGQQFTPEKMQTLMQEHSDEVSALRDETHQQLVEALSNIFRNKDISKDLMLKGLQHFENELETGVTEAYDQQKMQLEDALEEGHPEEIELTIENTGAEISRRRLKLLQNLQKATTEALNLATWEAIRTGSLSARQAASTLGISHASIPKRTAEIRKRFSPGV
jgi:hypothetical protein